ncbi:thiol-disulfide oxidoreductase DCC family protein [Halomonas smyrnensis]|uniref:thiol-disulfide oxidoreductase DCC family protein n=1 Tax=Halomonas smyrnensis TaxID=720605 RepID=UPI0004747710|nr:DCC1-like thiol-disulfide oxidoreductase family protein [Halomonas smyrnensis]
MADAPTLRVYYDAVCPKCRRDRRRYERMAGEASAVEWVDVTANQARLRERGIDPNDALHSLHVEDEHGRLFDGLDAYLLLMCRVPRLRPLAWLIGLPLIKPALAVAYRHGVRRRLRRQGRR